MWKGRGENFLTGAAPYYDVYQTKDGEYLAVGAIEPQFYSQLLKVKGVIVLTFKGMGLDPLSLPSQNEEKEWPRLKKLFAEVFSSKTRDEWTRIFEGTDACVSPVVNMSEVSHTPQLMTRQTFLRDADGSVQPAPAPQLSRTPSHLSATSQKDVLSSSLTYPEPGQHTFEVLREFSFSSQEIEKWRSNGTIDQAEVHSRL